MAELKTQKNAGSVEDFIRTIPDEKKQADSFALVEMMKKITGAEPVMWGPSIIGFGHYRYAYASGVTNDWFLTGFSPRKQNLSLYILSGFSRYEEILRGLGKFKTAKSCLYINRLTDINPDVLHELIETSVRAMRSPTTDHV